jgi:hypothetical protein
VQANRKGVGGRFLVLAVLEPITERKLVVVNSGCLDSKRQRIPCPGSSGKESDGGGQAEGKTYPETVGGEAHTWTDYRSAGGTQGQSIQGGETVQVSCRVRGFEVADGNAWWYRLALNPWNNNYYVSADPFYNNGQTSGPLTETPFVDESVPEC